MGKVRRIVQDAVRQTIHTCVIGASNKISDMQKTNGWVFFPMLRYNYSSRYQSEYIGEGEQRKKIWKFSSDDPIEAKYSNFQFISKISGLDPLNRVEKAHQELLLTALLTQEKRMGNCHARSCLLAKILWENHASVINHIEVLFFNFDHVVVVVNRSGDLAEPSTWGNDAFIADAWYPGQGQVYSADEFLKNTKIVSAFIKAEYTKQSELGLPGRKEIVMQTDWEEPTWECCTEILPELQPYPHLPHSLEYYYEPKYLYTAELAETPEKRDSFLEDRIKHQQYFKECIKEINAKKSDIPDADSSPYHEPKSKL